MTFFDHPYLWALFSVLSWPVYKILAKVFFGERYEDLGETLRYLLQFDLVSMFKGQYWDDVNATLNFHIFAFLCVGWSAAITELFCRAYFG